MKKKVNHRSIANLRPWRKGQSGNPGGRPKKLITDAILDAIEEDPQQVKKVATSLLKRAAKTDSAFVALRDTVQGKPLQEISGPDGQPIPVSVKGIDEAILKLLAVAEERKAGANFKAEEIAD